MNHSGVRKIAFTLAAATMAVLIAGIADENTDANAAQSSSRYVEAVSLNDPLAFYRLNESAGPTVFDSSSNRLSGSYLGAMSFGAPGATSDGDHSVVADDGNAVAANASSFPRSMQPRSAEFWLRVPQGYGSEYANGLDYHGLTYEWYPGGVYFTTPGVGHIGEIFPANIADNEWHQLAYTFDGRTLSAFVDGRLLGTNAAEAASGFQWNSTDNLTVSSSAGLDDISIFRQALSASDILRHYNAAVTARGASEIHASDGSCISIDSQNATAVQAPVVLAPCGGSTAQMWLGLKDSSVKSPAYGLCLDAANLGTFQLIAKSCNANITQDWYFDGKLYYSATDARCLKAVIVKPSRGDFTLGACGASGTPFSGPSAMTLDYSTATPRCEAFTNGEVWQTTTTWGRVRERPCVAYNSAVVFPVVQIQIDHPLKGGCTLTVGYPPQASAGCPLDAFAKTPRLRLQRAEIQVGASAFGSSVRVVCRYGPLLASGTFTLSCSGPALPHRTTSYAVSVIAAGGDVLNDGDGFKDLQPIEFDYSLV